MTVEFATVDPSQGFLGGGRNFSFGQWWVSESTRSIVDPVKGRQMLTVPETATDDEWGAFQKALEGCAKSGLHNPFKRPERYSMLGDVSARAAQLLADPHVETFFAQLIQRVMPKSWAQCVAEVRVTQRALANFSGDQVRFLATGFSVPGDHQGQESRGYRWPYGPVVIIAPFNFPLEIPALQLMGALYMGNFPLIKGDSRVSIVIEQFLRLLHSCGLPLTDVALVHADGPLMGRFVEGNAHLIRLVQFTGSSRVAEQISDIMGGRVKIEDAGFDWKILGPDAAPEWLDYVAWQCDQDAYAASGQKCSAQSILFAHRKWVDLGIYEQLAERAALRSLDDLTIGPVMTWTNQQIQKHVDDVLVRIPGSRLVFGGCPLDESGIPACYGSYLPTAVEVPFGELKEDHALITTELFGPFQIVVTYDDEDIPELLEHLENMQHHLTAAVVSNDPLFIDRILGATVNGTTYVGMRARTTGAPQNHWFGPAGDSRAAGIGTPGAIISTWSCHREVIADRGPLPKDWEAPSPT